jgi:hypothetical protein
MKIVEKCYRLNLWAIFDPYHSDGITVYAKSRGKAKSKIYYEAIYCGYSLRDGDEITYLNCPIERCKEYDKYDFGGKVMTKSKASISFNSL